MAFKVIDRVQETTISSGTGALQLRGATPQNRPFNTFFSTGDTGWLLIKSASTSDWEVSFGTYDAPTNSFTRAMPAGSSSSNANALVNFGTESKNISLILNAVTEAYFDPNGVLTVPGYIVVVSGRSLIKSSANGIIELFNNAANDFNLLRLGGSTSSFPALQRSTTELHVRLADDSDYTTVRASSLITMNSSLFLAANGFLFATGDGVFEIANAAGTSFNRLMFGGTTSSFPAWKRNGTVLAARLADDSADAPVSASQFRTGAPRTITSSSDTPGVADTYLICNNAGTVTLTLPTASSFTGRRLVVKTVTNNTVISNASNVVPANSTSTGTAILAATAGKFAELISDGTNWIIMSSN